MSAFKPRILVVDDEPNIRKLLRGTLADEGYEVVTASDTDEADRILAAESIDLLLLDVLLPGTDGLSYLRSQGEELPPTLMMSGHGTIETAVQATRLGALDFIEKPIQVERLLLALENALRLERLRSENRMLRHTLAGQSEILGKSTAIQQLREEIVKAAPTEARVLITGENGTGKELVARALREGSNRADKPFIKVNCAAIPSELLESELFGHEKGAFTGAVRDRRGKFELAQGGTLLLDEIGDMNPTTQAKLLRVLEEREMEKVGGERTISLDVRVLASTNRDLEHLLNEKSFREDLYHRLRVVPIHVAPLRQHPEDVEELAEHYLAAFCAENGRPALSLTNDALAALTSYEWPGNVRELKNLMERLTIMVAAESVEAADVIPLLRRREDAAAEEAVDKGLAQRLEAFERRVIADAVRAAGGNVAEAARRLGVDRANLHRKISRLGLDDE